jgi:uncharacterized protein YyaL (SSP411 family)
MALSLNDYLIKHFWDKENGGLFFTSDKSERLLIRKKEIYDGALPSSNSVCYNNFSRLFCLTGDINLKNKILELNKCFSNIIYNNPTAYTNFISSLILDDKTYDLLIIVGERKDKVMEEIINKFQKKFIPNLEIIFKKEGDSILYKFKPDSYKMINNKTTLYFCSDQTCKAPTNNVKDIMEYLYQ